MLPVCSRLTLLIEVLATRNKRHLARVSQGYRHYHKQDLSELVGSELSGWYRYLAQFIVLDTAQSDRLLLDLALDGHPNPSPSPSPDPDH